jgi:hypothetical protein
MIFTDLMGGKRLLFHWPNETPDERVKIVGVQVTDDGIRLLDDGSNG